jgi:hypothetical protein
MQTSTLGISSVQRPCVRIQPDMVLRNLGLIPNRYQEQFFDMIYDLPRLFVLDWGRQTGKKTAAIAYAIAYASRLQNRTVLCVVSDHASKLSLVQTFTKAADKSNLFCSNSIHDFHVSLINSSCIYMRGILDIIGKTIDETPLYILVDANKMKSKHVSTFHTHVDPVARVIAIADR